MRLKSGIWVSAYVRRCYVEGVFAVIRRRGSDEAGAIFIKVNRLDDTADVYARLRNQPLMRSIRSTAPSARR
jgi:hypothetical protein